MHFTDLHNHLTKLLFVKWLYRTYYFSKIILCCICSKKERLLDYKSALFENCLSMVYSILIQCDFVVTGKRDKKLVRYQSNKTISISRQRNACLLFHVSILWLLRLC